MVFDGTSQATALVSLTAGILYSQGVIDPHLIKRRILASTDFKSDLIGKVASEGVLNVSKALQFNVDLVQFKDHIESGELMTPTFIRDVEYDGDKITVEVRGKSYRLYKLVPHYSDKQGMAIRVTFLKDDKLVNGYTDSLVGKTISFKKTGGTTRDLSIEEIVDIVPRLSGAGSGPR